MLVLLACQLSLVEQYEGRQVMFELGFCSKPDSRSLAEQYERICDGDEGTTTTILYTTLLHCILLLIITVTLQSSE